MRPADLTPARPRGDPAAGEPWFIAAHAASSAFSPTSLPWSGCGSLAAARLPRARHPLLVHPGAALHRASASRGSLGPADGRGRRDAVRPACVRLRGAGLCRRVLPPARAALSALAAGAAGRRAARWCCAALVLLRAHRRRRRRAALDLLRAPLSARCCGRCCPCCCSGRSGRHAPLRAPVKSLAATGRAWRVDSSSPAATAATRGQRARARPSCATRERELSLFRRRLVLAGAAACCIAFGALLARFV